MCIEKTETLISGKWIQKDGKSIADDNCRRIENLVEGYLTLIGKDDSGWCILYQDSNDGRFWELSYPESGLHGGGPAQLSCISYNDAKEKYRIK